MCSAKEWVNFYVPVVAVVVGGACSYALTLNEWRKKAAKWEEKPCRTISRGEMSRDGG